MTFQSRDQAKAWQQEHDPHAPKAGDPAPDFELRDIDGQHRLRLSALKGQPVALVFGSFT